jgi:hypothetical protein
MTEIGEGVAMGGSDGAVQAQVLIEASEEGIPFCEVCEEPKRAASSDPTP